MRFTILLPSAEGKATGGNPLAPDMFDYRSSNTFNYFSQLNPERRALIDALQTQVRDGSDEDLAKLFGVKGDTLQEAVSVNLDVYRSPLMASVDRYGPGVMYAAMDTPNVIVHNHNTVMTQQLRPGTATHTQPTLCSRQMM